MMNKLMTPAEIQATNANFRSRLANWINIWQERRLKRMEDFTLSGDLVKQALAEVLGQSGNGTVAVIWRGPDGALQMNISTWEETSVDASIPDA